MKRSKMEDEQWNRIKEALYYLSAKSHASQERARGVMVGIMATMMCFGWDMKQIWERFITMMPDDLRVKVIPPAWVDLECVEWDVYLDEIVTFPDLLKDIPTEMLESKPEEYGYWTCRDKMLDKYLCICAIFQREFNRAVADHFGNSTSEDPEELPNIVCTFNPFRKARSQYIAEWAVSDMRKPTKDSYNWHGQNTSRWLYAGCLLVDNGRVSIHT